MSQQGSEAGLLEVAVEGQRVGYVPIFHDKEAGAVSEAPCLVASGGVPLHGGAELRCLSAEMTLQHSDLASSSREPSVRRTCFDTRSPRPAK